MTTKQATGIALKFFAIYLLFNLLMVVPSLVSIGCQMAEMSENQPSIVTRFLIPSIGVIVGIIAIGLFWKVSNSFVNKTTDEEPVINDMSVDDVMKTVLSCMGLFFALQGIISFLHVYASARSYTQHFHLDYHLLIVPSFKLVIGCVLIAKPKQWVKMIRSIGEK